MGLLVVALVGLVDGPVDTVGNLVVLEVGCGVVVVVVVVVVWKNEDDACRNITLDQTS